MKEVFLSLLILPWMMGVGCSGRGMGSGGGEEGDAGQRIEDGTVPVDGTAPMDGTVKMDASYDPDGQVVLSCEAQEVTYCSDPCMNVVGAWWDGQFCQPIICCCEGPDCDETYATPQACLDEHVDCDLNACAATGGYCDYGDFVMPTCLEGYGKDYTVTQQDSDVCGLGVCCAPCPDPESPSVGYIYQDPALCAEIDWECEPGARHFENECGCGCIIDQ